VAGEADVDVGVDKAGKDEFAAEVDDFVARTRRVVVQGFDLAYPVAVDDDDGVFADAAVDGAEQLPAFDDFWHRYPLFPVYLSTVYDSPKLGRVRFAG
jgi:hypothetical protein